MNTATRTSSFSLPRALHLGQSLYQVLDRSGVTVKVDLSGDEARVIGSGDVLDCVKEARREAGRIALEAARKLTTPQLLKARNKSLRFEVLEAVNETLFERGYRGLS